MLTTGQVAHFEAFGFLVLKQVFTAQEIAKMNGEEGRFRVNKPSLSSRSSNEGRTYPCYPTMTASTRLLKT